MRIALSITFVVLIIILLLCAVIAFHSKKENGKPLSLVLIALVLPVLGNLLIIASPYEALSRVGSYFYYIGLNAVMFAMMVFTHHYCSLNWPKWIFISLVSLLVIDTIQLLVGIGTHHAFVLESITVDGGNYWRSIPGIGQSIHRVIDYGILAGIMIVFTVKTIRTPRLYMEKYLVILLAMIAVAIWQTIYIFTRTPLDVSMIGFAVFGVLIFALVMFYRPFRLLDRMLATIASRMPEALFFFDSHYRCIWANDSALKLLNITSNEISKAPELLVGIFGNREVYQEEWADTINVGSGDEMCTYVVEKRAVRDKRNRTVGIYISIIDNSLDERRIRKEAYNASHDSLTKALNRAGYDELMNNIDLTKCFLLLIDLDYFKEMNDRYGHHIGDEILVTVTETLSSYFRDNDHVCRIGGDEFAVVMPNVSDEDVDSINQRISMINSKLGKGNGTIPAVTLSAGGAFGRDAENAYELFNNADHALYEVKFKGKRGFTLFHKR